MAASGLNHLKNDYRRRFCRPSRAPDIHRKQGQNMLKMLQDCFEEKSLISDTITNSAASLLCSTPKDCGIQSPSKEQQTSPPKSVLVSSRIKAASLQGTVSPGRSARRSVQVSEVHQKILASDVSSKSTPHSKQMSSEKLNDPYSKADDQCYLPVGLPAVLDAKTSVSESAIPSVSQKREACPFVNPVHTQSPRTEISLKTKKRLNFEDKDNNTVNRRENRVSEVKDQVPEGQEGTSSKTSQRRGQDLEYETKNAKKSFSTLFFETVERKNQLSPVTRHMAVTPPLSSPPRNINLEDEFIIDESDRSFEIRPWVTIPPKSRHVKHHITSPADGSATLQDRMSRERHHSASSDMGSHEAQPAARDQLSVEKRGTSCALTDELENTRSTKCEMYSENAKKSSGSKRTVKQKPESTLKANIVEEQLPTGQCHGEDGDLPCTAQDRLQRDSDRSMDECDEASLVGKKEKKNSTKKAKKQSREKHFLRGSENRFVPKEMTLTINRSGRISRSPSDWWVVKPEQNLVDRNSSIRNELPVCHKNRLKHQKPRKPAKKTNQNAGERTLPSKRSKAATPKSAKVRGSGRGTTHHDELPCLQHEPLGSNKADLSCPRTMDQSKYQDSVVTAQDTHSESPTTESISKQSTHQTELNLDSGESKVIDLEESGPSRLNNYEIAGKNNSGMEEKEVQEYLDDSRIKRYKVSTDRKVHHKIVLPSNTPNVRRTKRIRLKPLEYWRGERVHYQERKSGGFVIDGVLSPASPSYKRKAKGNTGKISKTANMKRIRHDIHERKDRSVLHLDIPLGDPLQPTQVKDPDTSDVISMDLIRPRDTYKFFIEHNNLKVYKTLDTSIFSTGKLVLGPFEEKGKQHVGQDILIFYVSFGDLLCTLHETPYMITTGDSFYVPSGNYYNVKNLRNENSILLFTQIKR